jgi:hypothetical protein
MSNVGERRRCSVCNELVKITALTPNDDNWYTQQLECGHTGRIRIIEPVEENLKEELEASNHQDVTDETNRQ